MLKINRSLITLLFPAHCLGCEKELPQPQTRGPLLIGKIRDTSTQGSTFQDSFETHWCLDCWKRLNDHTPRCPKCAATVAEHNVLIDRCPLCRDLDLKFDSVVSVGDYKCLIQELVIRMKNQLDEQLAVQLGNLLGYHIHNSDIAGELNLIVPIPTHWWRRAKRGFHGAEILARSVASACEIPYSANVLRCVRNTKKQGTLTTAGRFRNVQNAFGLRSSHSLSGLNIMLIDDVMTSGATLSEAARILLKAGASKVYTGVIARGARVS